MRRRVTAKLTYANVLSTLAIFLVLGGGAYAAVTLPKNSVGTEQIQRDGVTKPDVAPDAIGNAELKIGSVRTKQVADGSLQCKDFKPSADACGRGPAGPAGADGVDAAGGAPTVVARSHTEPIELTCTTTQDPAMGGYWTNCSGSETVRAECAPGEVATGGSAEGDKSTQDSGVNLQTRATEDRPDPSSGQPTAWAAEVTSSGFGYAGSNANPPPPANQDFTVYVVCAS